jgi:hypothetical protein
MTSKNRQLILTTLFVVVLLFEVNFFQTNAKAVSDKLDIEYDFKYMEAE